MSSIIILTISSFFETRGYSSNSQEEEHMMDVVRPITQILLLPLFRLKVEQHRGFFEARCPCCPLAQRFRVERGFYSFSSSLYQL